jgi:hypothetical protein
MVACKSKSKSCLIWMLDVGCWMCGLQTSSAGRPSLTFLLQLLSETASVSSQLQLQLPVHSAGTTYSSYCTTTSKCRQLSLLPREKIPLLVPNLVSLYEVVRNRVKYRVEWNKDPENCSVLYCMYSTNFHNLQLQTKKLDPSDLMTPSSTTTTTTNNHLLPVF